MAEDEMMLVPVAFVQGLYGTLVQLESEDAVTIKPDSDLAKGISFQVTGLNVGLIEHGSHPDVKEDKAGWQCCTCKTAVTVPPLPPCPIHSDVEKDLDEPVEYQCLYLSYDGKLAVMDLGGTSASHAFTEAWHECEGTVLAVRKA